MIINDLNGEIINSKIINFHDDILKKLSFERENNILKLIIKKEKIINETCEVHFVDVLGFQITACDFWGKSPHILDFEYVEKRSRILLPQLLSLKEDNLLNPNCKLINAESCIETVLTFGSGDKLIVVADHIIL